MKQQKYIFYCGESNKLIFGNTTLDLENDCGFEIWKPRIYRISPKGLFFPALLVWWVFHYCRIFRTLDYRIFLIYFKNKKVAHYSVVLPKHFRTPFMDKNDLQIGPVGTDKNHRRRGLASYAIQRILNFYKTKNSKFWYVVREENEGSRKLIEKIGFIKCGEGIKKKRFGFGLFDVFVLSEPKK